LNSPDWIMAVLVILAAQIDPASLKLWQQN
jgi:hypothetical protein